eukprot:SAG22_NODE_2679_length_2314_cov_1.732280_3_plen_446_part_01
MGSSGDYYVCSQVAYGSGAGVSTSKNRTWWKDNSQHMAYWQLQLGYMGQSHHHHHHGRRRQLQHSGGSGGHDSVQSDSLAVCLPSACGPADVKAFAKPFLRALGVNISFAKSTGPTAGYKYWLQDPLPPAGIGTKPLGFGGWLWLAVSAVLVLLATYATLPYPYGLSAWPAPVPAPVEPASLGGGGGLAQQVGGELVLKRNSPLAGPQMNAVQKLVAHWDMNRNFASLVKPDVGHPGLRVLNGLRCARARARAFIRPSRPAFTCHFSRPARDKLRDLRHHCSMLPLLCLVAARLLTGPPPNLPTQLSRGTTAPGCKTRVIAILFVVLGHTYQSMLFGVDNQIYAELTVQPRLASQMITGGQLGVDTFFFLSGFLSSHVGLKKLRGRSPPVLKTVVMSVVDRWLRLTPLYFAVLMIWMYLLPKLSVAPERYGGNMVYVGPDEAHHHD